MTHDPTQDAHSLGIALRLAQAQNRELRKQLAASTSNGSLKFQDGICHDCESPDLCIQDNGCHNSGKIFSRNDRPTCEKADSTSETPRTQKKWDDLKLAVDLDDYQKLQLMDSHARFLERELAQAIKERDEARKDAWWFKQCAEFNGKQLATAKEALEFCLDQSWNGPLPDKARKFAAEALAAINENEREPLTEDDR